MMNVDPRQEWATPADFYAAVHKEFRPSIDVCARAENKKCPVFISPEQNALRTGAEWLSDEHPVAWCNPGFSDPMPWMQKAVTEIVRYEFGAVLVLGLVSPSAKWWRYCEQNATQTRLIGGKRIQFEPAAGVAKSSNARENALFVFTGYKYSIRPMPNIWTWYWSDK